MAFTKLRNWRNRSNGTPLTYVLMRSRYQPFTTYHVTAIKSFFREIAPAVRKAERLEPILVLAIVRNLLRGTSFGTYVDEKVKAEPNSPLATYRERFKPELNPLYTFEILDDMNVALAHELSKKERSKLMVTVMPDFACTIHMLNDSKLRADIKDLLFDFLPERRRWAIPLFDQDDETDYKLAETKGERVYPINVQFGDFANSASGEAEYGLYYHSTKWLLSQDLNNLSKVVPKTVLDRWAASGRLDIIKERIKFPVNGTTWEQGFAALQNNLGVKRPSEARDNKDGQETVQQLDNDLDDIFTSLDDI